MKIPLARSLLLLPVLCAAVHSASIFDKPELRVTRSPNQVKQLAIPDGARVLDYDVSPVGPVAAILALGPSGAREVLLWDVNQAQAAKAWDVPAGFQARSLAWHPEGEAFFLSGAQGQQYVIFKVEKSGGAWRGRQIYASRQEIRRLVPGPRPYIAQAASSKDVPAYRLFFGTHLPTGGYSVHSIREDGKREYQVVGPASGITKFEDAGADPSTLTAASALPAGFHPAGHILIWEDGKGCFQAAAYSRDHWEDTAKLLNRDLCGGTVGATPNGAAIIHWVSGADGVGVISRQGVQTHEATGYQLVSAPSSVPDGRGIVGVTRTASGFMVNYIPIHVPLADVVNAWMFLESATDTDLFSRHGGLFRNLSKDDQLYQLYDSEQYQCGHDLDESTPTRPYLVTTDAFWELFAAAYEGIFIVRERETAIPAFWDFVKKASAALRQVRPLSKWAGVFAALSALHTQPASSPEAQRIARADGSHASSVIGMEFDYGELKPRGHYSATPAAQKYFEAFRYLMRVSSMKLPNGENWPTAELRQLPESVKSAAVRWIGAYQDMIAPSRAPLVWSNQLAPPRSYVKHPSPELALFPLAWGFDNEVLLSAVYHQEWPAEERIEGPSGAPRLLPSGLDVATALGSRFAAGLLADEFGKYPRLKDVLAGLGQRNRGPVSANLYDQWIEALGQQWADSVPSPGGQLDESLWRTKRLQTGLASWATLRHATVLVNEREGAECGEGAFEFIIMRPPRGYVEPDAEMFGRLAGLFDAAAKVIGAIDNLTGMLPPEDEFGEQNRIALKQGILRRLSETVAKARLFQTIAAKEVRGEVLTASEYEEILYFGRVAEHHFLIFKSLANKDLALSTPNPIPKIADVSDVQGHAPYWMAAVGRPLEWDHSVPYYGRREIVKGAAYSFYEFASDRLLNDAEWLKQAPAQPRPTWIAPYLSLNDLSCPARNPF